MKLKFNSFLTLLLLLLTSSHSFAESYFYCSNSNNENQDWATVPGNSEGWANARSACASQGGTGFTASFPNE